MKKVYFLFLILVYASQAYAQEEASPGSATLGAKIGGNATYLWGQGSGLGTITPVPGGHVGMFLKYQLSDKISIQPELLFSSRGINVRRYYHSNGSGFYTNDPKLPNAGYSVDEPYSYRTKVDIFYVDLPVMINFQVIDKLKLQLGGVGSWNVWDSYPKTYTQDNIRIQGDKDFATIQPWELSGAAGVSYDFLLMDKKVTAGARYTLGLTRINNADRATSDLKSSTFSLSLAYELFQL